MRVILKAGNLILACEHEDEHEGFATWLAAHRDHAFHLADGSATGCALRDLGPRADACREPINILFDQGDPRWAPISNLAHSPFELRGRAYASVEGFWQGLKFESEERRARVAALWGKPAKAAARGEPARATFAYDGEIIATGGPRHRALMVQACRAKFSQGEQAREALLATGDRPLTHHARRDSVTIPGAMMADIWMRARAWLRNREGAESEDEPVTRPLCRRDR